MTRHPQIGQRKQGDDLASVLLQSAIANLGKTELLLDDPERMFNNRTDSRQHTLVTVFLLVASCVQAGDRCAGALSNWAETEICSDLNLKGLDEKLNNVYSLVRQSVSDKTSLRNTQLKWLRLIRNGCESKECLSRVYEERVTELSELLVSSTGIRGLTPFALTKS